MSYDFILAGCGNVGRAILRHLAQKYSVLVVDISAHGKILAEKYGADFKKKSALEIDGRVADIAINALPGSIGYDFNRVALNASMCVVDISFHDHDPFLLENICKKRNAVYVPDAGFAPGLSNMVAGHLYAKKPDEIVIRVGGIAEEDIPPLGLALTWSVEGLIDEYLRDARARINGREVRIKPTEDVQHFEIPGVGMFEEFYTDGLRTMLRTMDTPTLIEKTLRHKGHMEKVRVLMEIGLIGRGCINLDGVEVERWRILKSLLEHSDAKSARDLCIMHVMAKCVATEEAWKYLLVDRYDEKTGMSAMSRTTGYTCAIIAEHLLNKEWSESMPRAGVVPPETFGMSNEIYDKMIRDLAKLDILIRSIP
ncbi:MAG: hypothetical protein DRN20_05465 [Thermoplasmata archaeon]|nr:MAG: hypothetical protein DRN20_05465 [Thermoplasmata archaeon]